MIALLLALVPPADDWAATGSDCIAFACADLDGDGIDDIACINAPRQAWVSLSVNGWKAAGWELAAEGVGDSTAIGLVGGELVPGSPGEEVAVFLPDRAIVLGAYSRPRLSVVATIEAPVGLVPGAWGVGVRDDSGAWWTIRDGAFAKHESAPISESGVEPPPFEPGAPALGVFRGDVTGDGVEERLGVFACTRPHHHHAVRVEAGPNVASGDTDHDGLADAMEAQVGSNPLDRDTDDDGLLDGWEVHGLPRGVAMPETRLNPMRQDVICAIAPYEGLDIAAVRAELERSLRLYSQLSTPNPDGSTGMTLHLRFDPPIPAAEGGDWWAVGERFLSPEQRGLVHWMQIPAWGAGGQAAQTGDMGGSGANWASFAHELGHQLSLSHEGDSAPAWCPLYPSLMNYAFSYGIAGDGEAIRFSEGRFRGVELREGALVEHLPFPYETLKYLESGPFHFTLEDDGAGGTRIDWNQNGRFDEGTVEADINYGASTSGGRRVTIEPTGGSPRLIRAYGRIHVALLSPSQDGVRLRTYRDGTEWSEPRAIPNSATNDDPVLVGTDVEGFVLVRRVQGWAIARFDETSISAPTLIAGLPNVDLSAGLLDGRVLLVGRRDTDELSTWWLLPRDGGYTVEPGPAVDFRSSVPVDFCIDAATGRIVFVGSATHAQAGPLCMHIAWYRWEEGKLIRDEGMWIGGERAGIHCTTRPVVRTTAEGDLYIFHTGWPQDDGQMTAWRTKRIGNRELRDGWLVCLMYDVWTRTRRAVSFELEPQRGGDGRRTAIYAYRWDAAEAHGMHVNDGQVAHDGLGIDLEPMRDHDDGEKMSKWGIRHSILYMRRD